MSVRLWNCFFLCHQTATPLVRQTTWWADRMKDPYPRTHDARWDMAEDESAMQHQLIYSSTPEMNFQTPLTTRARFLSNELRRSEMWGNDRKRKRLGALRQKGSFVTSSPSNVWRWHRGLMTARFSVFYLLTSKANAIKPKPSLKAACGIQQQIFFSDICKLYNQNLYKHQYISYTSRKNHMLLKVEYILKTESSAFISPKLLWYFSSYLFSPIFLSREIPQNAVRTRQRPCLSLVSQRLWQSKTESGKF